MFTIFEMFIYLYYLESTSIRRNHSPPLPAANSNRELFFCNCISNGLQRQSAEISCVDSICYSNSESLSSPQNVAWNGDNAGRWYGAHLANLQHIVSDEGKTRLFVTILLSQFSCMSYRRRYFIVRSLRILSTIIQFYRIFCFSHGFSHHSFTSW